MSAGRAREIIDELTAGGSPALSVPKSLSYVNALSVTSIAQAVITWGTHPATSTLITDLDLEDVDAARVLSRNAVLMTAIELADEIQRPDGADVTDRCKALAAFTLRHWSSDVPQIASGVEVGTDRTVMAVDHEPALRSPRGMYPRGDLDEQARPFFAGRAHADVHQMRGRHPFGHRVLGVSGQRPPNWADRYAATGHALGVVLFELFQNTDLHARLSVHGKLLPKSVRLMHARGFAQTRDVLSRSDPDNRGLMEYFARTSARESGGHTARFLSVSVLDSGPGMAGTLLRRQNITRPESPQQELTYFLRALRMTSGGSTREPMRGLGLRRVQSLLSALGGFARIRSGRFEIQRDFVRHPFDGPDERESMWWGNVAEPRPTQKVAGTAITLLLPIPPLADAATLWEVASDD
ncbi:hypothetical protein N3K63_03185 [Microbacterium sp. W1N]|uniref:hypothetical protein n=1 Tax=Microbacterium festucae TaxID=2977531 RepID=UPI0021C07552|nr:hypothetical protein [Microbacterium festucae]MCT9819285.1 hypothetical protein [Microbacterium festucae]